MAEELYIGVMSGTSMDAVDTIVAQIDANEVRLVSSHSQPFPSELKNDLIKLGTGSPVTLKTLGQIDNRLGQLFADAINAQLQIASLSPSHIRATGCHGQTVFHDPEGEYPFTMQIGDANLIAAKTGIVTIADFRRKDMALGGQGAPLLPAFHQHVLAKPDRTRVVLNIGGISNISVLIPGKTPVGYDTGPGNMLMDAWIYRHKGEQFDKEAHWAKSGTVNNNLLNLLMSEPYFSQRFPKSTGRELFNLPWLEEFLRNKDIPAHDVQATLAELTALTLANEVKQFATAEQGDIADELLVCGGGARNPLLMERLKRLLPEWKVTTTDDAGVPGDEMEALAFAWLAYRTVHGLSGNLPAVTGAIRETILGAMYFPD
ncbi:anhydro-N-acetylmuramic acid kinase [Parasalinivibrio latis]|uniref:anhydro-N-acetylmuramic acid kinase n=1 Tax=Parasalinivibrio latis TaxID=2952610 RepID=UPI0030E471A6